MRAFITAINVYTVLFGSAQIGWQIVFEVDKTRESIGSIQQARKTNKCRNTGKVHSIKLYDTVKPSRGRSHWHRTCT